MSTQAIDFSKYESAAPPSIDFSKYEAQPKQPDAVPSFWDTLSREGKAFTGTIAGIPAAVYHAFAEPATKEEIQKYGADQVTGAKRLGLGMDRLITAPVEVAGKFYADAAKGKYGDASQVESAMLNEAPEAVGSAAGSVVASRLASEAPGAAQAIVEKTPAAAQAVGDTGAAAVRATAGGVNTALAKAPGVIGGAAGATIGHATGIPEGGLLGYMAGKSIGEKVLPKIQVPGESFGLPKTVSGGPVNAPQYVEPPVVNPGAPLPANPSPELMQARPLAQGGSAPSPEPAAALGNLPSTAQSPAERLPEAFQPRPPKPPEIPGTADAPFKPLTDLPPHAVMQAVNELGTKAPLTAVTERANNIARLSELLNQGLGGKGLEPNVPIKNQGGIITPTESVSSGTLPEGHIPLDSSALKSYKYDPTTREFESVTQGGQHYVHGDVDPAQVAQFEAADSKGKAWAELRKNSTLVAKIVNGKRVAVKPVISEMDKIPDDEWEAGHELEPQVEGSSR